ncbi:RAB6-interacting golgin [Condylostylus longicornis]|uniref:RAB6-interacting golgin n=1 Tax=Condylostylus longicornis TaxID=2530218 RepID=UPI00244DDA9B|nr:RAB6-interacting golgin [Condylostylus longicornis]
MSTKFDGFSQEEINKINGKPKKGGLFAAKSLGVGRGIRRVPDKMITSTSSQNQNQIVNQKNSKNNENGVKMKLSSVQISGTSAIDYDKKISDESITKLQEAAHFRPLSMKTEKIVETKKNTDLQSEAESTENDSIIHLSQHENKNLSINDSDYIHSVTQKETKLPQMSPFRGVSLKDFEAHRKFREEQNKIKKDILYKAIEKHSQKTAAEAKKIEEIKNELAKLDQDLAADVAILRKQIETACINYANIEKHYNKVEQMFLKAKLDLHNASEKKELLTEHLCTVITHNEDRKAKKLTELMEKVGLSPSSDDLQLNENDHTNYSDHISSKNEKEVVDK